MPAISLHIERFIRPYRPFFAPAILFFVNIYLLAPASVTAQPARLYVSVTNHIADAEVFLDNEFLGKTDSQGIFSAEVKAPSTHTVTVRKNGYEAQERTFTFQPGLGEFFEVSLPEVGSILLIHTRPGSALVFIDDRYFGRTDRSGDLVVRLRSGWHTIHVEKEGFATTQKRRVRAWDFAENVTFVLEPKFWLWSLFEDHLRLLLFLFITVLLAVLLHQILGDKDVALLLQRLRALVTFPTRDRIAGYSLAQARLLGRGGMANVYLVYDRQYRKKVALKVMDAGLLSDHDLVRKFLKEGEALKRIASRFPKAPVVRAYRYGRDHRTPERRPYLVLEYLEGFSLLRLLRRQHRLPLLSALDVAEQVAQGLAAAHANQIWHRDVTPDNVMVLQTSPQIRVKLIDFGVAKHEYTNTRTLDGSITGKPPYMSPEQCRGEPLDGRTDIYSLGIMLYTMLNGSPPFTNANPLMVMRMHEIEPLPPLSVEVPEEVSALLYRMLAKRREDRPATMKEVVHHIRHIRSHLSSPAHKLSL